MNMCVFVLLRMMQMVHGYFYINILFDLFFSCHILILVLSMNCVMYLEKLINTLMTTYYCCCIKIEADQTESA